VFLFHQYAADVLFIMFLKEILKYLQFKLNLSNF